MGTGRRRDAGRGARLALVAVLAAGALAAAPAASSHTSQNLSLYVYFGVAGDITVKLPDGTPLGVQSGAPTVIPAGYYSVVMLQPGCVSVSTFDLQGPGVNMINNLSTGEDVSQTVPVFLQPSSTYTWRNDANRSVVYTFVTSPDVVGTLPPNPLVKLPTKNPPNAPSGNSDVVGSAVAPFRGTLRGRVTAAGLPALSLQGRKVSTLRPGRYTIVVTDRSRVGGFELETGSHRPVTVTGRGFTGERSASVVLTAGGWTVLTGPGSRALKIRVA
jgi:hypothetical protein